MRIIFVALLLSLAPPSTAEETLKNEDVLAMVKAELSDDIILTKIRTTAVDFDMSTGSLIELKKAGVPETVLEEMLTKPRRAGNTDAPGMIYIYRLPSSVFGKVSTPSVYVDGIEVAKLNDGRHFAVTAVPGRHIVGSVDARSGVELQIVPATNYFVRIDTGLSIGKPVMVPLGNARFELKRTKPLKPQHAKELHVIADPKLPE